MRAALKELATETANMREWMETRSFKENLREYRPEGHANERNSRALRDLKKLVVACEKVLTGTGDKT